MFLALNGHHMLIELLAQSFIWLPLALTASLARTANRGGLWREGVSGEWRLP